MKSSRKSLGRIVPLTLAALLLAGCGSGIEGTPTAGEIDVRTLDVGVYPTDPLDYRKLYRHSLGKGAELAVVRLAGFVANGWEIDPSLQYGRRAKPITAERHVGSVLAKVHTEIAGRHNMMFGFTMSVGSKQAVEGDYSLQSEVNERDEAIPDSDATTVNLTVLQFPDADAAARAAAEIEAADFAVAAESNEAVTIDRYPAAKAHWRPGIPTLGTTMSQGSYLINVFVKKPAADLPALVALTQQSLGAQLPLLDQLPPLSAREMLRLAYDPQAMLRRTLHPDQELSPGFAEEAVYTPRSYLHMVSEQRAWREIIERAGIDAVAEVSSTGQLLRARDRAAATSLLDDFKSKATQLVDAPLDIPEAFCNENAGTTTRSASNRFYCTVRYDRYVARVVSAQLTDAQQRAAAQYALLAKSAWM